MIGVYPNPILGVSEGEMKSYKLKSDYKNYLRKSRDSSLERSRSKSRLIKLKEAEQEKEQNESFAYLI